MLPIAATSYWGGVKHNVSEGFDISTTPVLNDNELLNRFKNAVNYIAEVLP